MEELNKKEEIIEFLKMIFVIILTFFVLISLVLLSFSGTKNNIEEKKFISELFYLEKLVKASLFNNTHIKSIEDLKSQIEKDDKQIEDFIKRGLLDDSDNKYSDLSSFKKSERKVYFKNDQLWIDYSSQKIENNKYIVNVSFFACAKINSETFDKNKKCIDRKFIIDLLK